MTKENAPMVRAQLLLTQAQRRRLGRLAEREGRSLSDVARRALDAGLDEIEGHTDEALRQELEALEGLRHTREAMRERFGVYQGDLVAETRDEHEQDRDGIWQSP
jgi:predicted DNA-binding protein